MSDNATPRTDAVETPASTGDADAYSPMMVSADFARTLERESVEQAKRIAELGAEVTRLKDWQNRGEYAERLCEERAKRIAELEADLKLADSAADDVGSQNESLRAQLSRAEDRLAERVAERDELRRQLDFVGKSENGSALLISDITEDCKALREQVATLHDALMRAKPYVCWCDPEGRSPSDYPEAAAALKADRAAVEAALAATAPAQEAKP
jgi:DNA repair exonuclease SbcCD ATPase subunit